MVRLCPLVLLKSFVGITVKMVTVTDCNEISNVACCYIMYIALCVSNRLMLSKTVNCGQDIKHNRWKNRIFRKKIRWNKSKIDASIIETAKIFNLLYSFNIIWNNYNLEVNTNTYCVKRKWSNLKKPGAYQPVTSAQLV